METGYRFWKGWGLWFNEVTGLYEKVDLEFDLFHPIDDDFGRLYLENFLRKSGLIWKGKKIVTVFVVPKYFRKVTYTVK